MVHVLSDVGGISGVRSTLTSVKVPPDVIEEIVAILEENSGDLNPDGFRSVKGTWYGGSASAQVLGSHTEKAHLALENAVVEAVAGLQETGGAIKQFDRELSAADADSEAAAQALLHRTQLAVDQMDGDRHTPPSQQPTDPSGSA